MEVLAFGVAEHASCYPERARGILENSHLF